MSDLSGQNPLHDGSRFRIALQEWDKQVERFIAERDNPEKYGLVVVWHRWIDVNLTKAIRATFQPKSKSSADKLLEYPGGLSSFSARVHLGRCMGLYGATTYADLKIINEIRNDFAHPRSDNSGGLAILGFDNPRITSKCAKLKFIDHCKILPKGVSVATAEERFTNTASMIAGALWDCHLLFDPHSISPGTFVDNVEFLLP